MEQEVGGLRESGGNKHNFKYSMSRAEVSP